MHHSQTGVQNEAKPQTVVQETNMDMVAKKRGNRKQVQVDLVGKACWIGVDVHKSSYAVAILEEDGQRLEFSTVADPQRLLLQLLKMGMRIESLVYESGPTGYGLAWTCQEHAVPVVIVAPSRIPRPVSKSGKTDRLDSMNLVELLARGMMKSIAIPDREEFALREMERARQSLIKARRKVRQEIRSFLLRNGLAEPPNLSRWSQIAVRALTAMSLPEYLQNSLAVYLDEHASILASLSRITAQLAEAAVAQGHEERVKNLRTIPGVGETIAAC
jgi:transposase